jgi:hypothetical protein
MILDEVIKATNRRVNAIEHVVIPRLENTVAYINSELDEMDRSVAGDLTMLEPADNLSSSTERNSSVSRKFKARRRGTRKKRMPSLMLPPRPPLQMRRRRKLPERTPKRRMAGRTQMRGLAEGMRAEKTCWSKTRTKTLSFSRFQGLVGHRLYDNILAHGLP